ncbi:condensation domain-containing protein [Massilia rubra]|uniref:Condensation domain-containing protein n=1 Tax=Massilia rubra TaxID=2607910 RepID=A0ABX0LY08_9BURK|nr:hypothetical protein [Massilia rubra]
MSTAPGDGLRRAVSPIEEGLLFHDFYCDDGVYVDHMVCDIVGQLDRARFEETLRQLVRMHEILHTFYVRDNWRLAAEIRPSCVPALPFHDLSDRREPRETARRKIAADAHAPLDPSQHVSRCALYRLAPQDHVFSWTYHHALADSWTLHLLQQHFCAIYRAIQEGRAIAQPATPYSDYVRFISAQDATAVNRFWSGYLASAPRAKARTVPGLDARGGRTSIRIALSAQARAHLDQVRREQRVTLNIAVLAMWGLFALARQGTGACLLGCAVFGRSLPLKGIHTVAGVCSNTVPVVISETTPLAALLPQLQKHVLEASSRSFLSVGDMLASAGLSHHDMHSVVNFSIDKSEVATPHSAALPFAITNIDYAQAASFDTYLDVEIGEAVIALTVHFDQDGRTFSQEDDRRTCETIAGLMAGHGASTVGEIVDTVRMAHWARDAAFDFSAEHMP